MPFFENICRDFQGFSDNAFTRITSASKFGLYTFNHVPSFGLLRFQNLKNAR